MNTTNQGNLQISGKRLAIWLLTVLNFLALGFNKYILEGAAFVGGVVDWAWFIFLVSGPIAAIVTMICFFRPRQIFAGVINSAITFLYCLFWLGGFFLAP